MNNIIQYIHRPNLTELGMGNTNDKYLVCPASEAKFFFPEGKETIVFDEDSDKIYTLYSKIENSEFRVKRLSEIFDNYQMDPGDELVFTRFEINGSITIKVRVNECGRIFLNQGKRESGFIKDFEIINLERFPGFSKDVPYINSYMYMGKEHRLEISFSQNRPKRNDSPQTTDFYTVRYDGKELENIKNSYYYLTIRKGNAILKMLPKYEVKVLLESGKENSSGSIIPNLQQIFYGAPGTGKSHTIQERTEHEDVIRTTFHPDTDYSTFVGAYKPTTIDAPVMTVIGTKAVPVENEDGSPRIEPKIIYEFVNQAFLQAYVKAWEKYCEGGFDNAQKQFLVIEEINRGNCAQIFGDLFQLLDRNNAGFSDYPIKADADMAKQLKKQLKDLTIEDPDAINSLYKGEDIVSQVLNGELLLLPKNLYIWATMNTSDQSLFPIDSAFKRRWDWQYMPIANGFENWYISVDDYKFDWWLFLQKINKLIGATTHSEDKKLGYYFCKAKNKEIDANLFVSKVIFYLWNDVFKDYEFANSVFDDIDGKKLTFDKFYTTINGNTIVVEDKVVMFLNKLDEAIDKEYSMLLPNAEATTDQSGNDFTNYSFEGSAPMGKSALGKAIMLKYLNENAGLTFDEIKAKFPDSLLGSVANKGLIVKDEEDLGSYQRYYVGGFKSADGVKFKIYKQWTVGNIQNIKNFAFSQGWSVEEKGSWRRKDNNA